MRIETKEEFKGFKDEFWGKMANLPIYYGLGQRFKDPITGGVTTTRWVRINPPGTHLGSFAALASLVGLDAQNITDMTRTKVAYMAELGPENCTDMLSTFFRPFISEVVGIQHVNLQTIQAGAKKDTGWGLVFGIFPETTILNAEPVDHHDLMFRLTAMSQLHYRPNELNLGNPFQILPRLIFTQTGAILPESHGPLLIRNEAPAVLSDDKFPPIHWGTALPDRVRVADPSRVRLGAYLAQGTTVMQEGFVNFNAGTLGPCMVEGRISAGVTVDADTDIGGGQVSWGPFRGAAKRRSPSARIV